MKRWIRKSVLDARIGRDTPVPTEVISNEEYAPPPQTRAQREVERRLEQKQQLQAARSGSRTASGRLAPASPFAGYASNPAPSEAQQTPARCEARSPELRRRTWAARTRMIWL